MANRYWVGGTGTWDGSTTTHWSATSGGAAGASAPTVADNVFFDASSGTAATVTIESTAAALTTTVDKTDINLTLNGNATLSAVNSNFTFTSGTLTLNTHALTVGRFSSSNSNTRSIAFGTGKIIITGNSITILNLATATGLSYTGTANIEANYSGSTGTRVFRVGNTAGGSAAIAVNLNITAGTDIADVGGYYINLNYTGYKGAAVAGAVQRFIYGNIIFDSGMAISGASNTTFSATSGTQQITSNEILLDVPLIFNGIGGTFAFQDTLTQGSTRAFTVTNGTVQLKNGVTSTVGAFATSGTNQKFLQSTTLGLQATLSQASGTVDASYLTIRDINATGGATWNSFVDQSNIDAGNNDGWNFGVSPVIGGAEYTYQLRSFTQPRRF